MTIQQVKNNKRAVLISSTFTVNNQVSKRKPIVLPDVTLKIEKMKKTIIWKGEK